MTFLILRQRHSTDACQYSNHSHKWLSGVWSERKQGVKQAVTGVEVSRKRQLDVSSNSASRERQLDVSVAPQKAGARLVRLGLPHTTAACRQIALARLTRVAADTPLPRLRFATAVPFGSLAALHLASLGSASSDSAYQIALPNSAAAGFVSCRMSETVLIFAT